MSNESFDSVEQKEYESVKQLFMDGLLSVPSSCRECSGVMILAVEHQPLRFRFRCRLCGASSSIREGTIFSGSRLRISQIIDICRCWWKKKSLEEATQEASTTQATACKWYQK